MRFDMVRIRTRYFPDSYLPPDLPHLQIAICTKTFSRADAMLDINFMVRIYVFFVRGMTLLGASDNRVETWWTLSGSISPVSNVRPQSARFHDTCKVVTSATAHTRIYAAGAAIRMFARHVQSRHQHYSPHRGYMW